MEILVVYLVEAGLFFLFCKLRLLKWACFIYAILLALQFSTLGLLLMYANPRLAQGAPPTGHPVLPMLVALLLVFVAFWCALPSRRETPELPPKVSPARYAVWAGGVLLPFLGLAVFLISVYAPGALGATGSMAVMGAWALALGLATGAALLYFASRLNAAGGPNRMRWWVLGAVVFWLGDKITVGSLILLYVAPPPNADYAPAVSWLCLAAVPLALLLVGLARQAVPQPRRAQAAQAEAA